MNKLALNLLIGLSLVAIGRTNLPDTPEEYASWEKKLLAAIEEQKTAPPEIAIPKLGGWISKLSQGMNVEKGDRPVFRAAQEVLLSIPGHAKYYQDKIEGIRELVMAHAKLPKEEQYRMQAQGTWVGPGNYEDVREDAFNVLGLLPSPETVAVLGHFIEDPEERDGKNLLGQMIEEPSDLVPTAPNFRKASIAISYLGIEKPPARPADRKWGDANYDLKEVDAWKDWWNEVKTGKRTYRFKGSPIEYGADGPATKEQIERVALNQRMESDRAARHGKNSGAVDSASPVEGTPVSRKPATVALIAAALGLLGSIVWYVRRAKAAG